MSSFNYTVDTEPMASEISNVSRHVNVTTGAVIAMQAAVIAAEESAADHVCSNLNRGFYSLIRSQISQKIARLQSDVDSNLMQLVQQKTALIAIKSRMERDYNMISNRYFKLFGSLNSNLKSRIYELDAPTIEFANKEVEKIYNRSKYLTATIPVSQVESISGSQQIIVSNIKFRNYLLLNSMKSFISQMTAQKKITDKILIKNNNVVKIGKSFIPVIIFESKSNKSGNISSDVIVSQSHISTASKGAIINHIYNNISEKRGKLDANYNDQLNTEFYYLLSAAPKKERIKNYVLSLFKANSPEKS